MPIQTFASFLIAYEFKAGNALTHEAAVRVAARLRTSVRAGPTFIYVYVCVCVCV